MTALFVGVGVGPGDPELMTLKAWRMIQNATVISYIANEAGHSQAKDIAAQALAENAHSPIEIPVCVPMTIDRSVINQRYDDAAKTIQAYLNAGENVLFICEGDPLFFGSFAYLLGRLESNNPCQVIPGISSVHAAASALQLPLTMLKESFVVVSGRHNEQQLVANLQAHDTVVIMKAGRSRQAILNALRLADRTDDAHYLEYIGRDNQKIVRDVRQLGDDAGPYFSLFVVMRPQGDRT